MGGGLAFLTKKSFNPANWSNQRQVWEARQNHETEKRRIAERESQLKREREEEDLARVVGGEVDGGRKALGFMYDAGKVPGLERRNNNDDYNEGFEKSGGGVNGDRYEDGQGNQQNQKGAGGEASSIFERQPGDDDAAAAFRAMLAKPPADESPSIENLAGSAAFPQSDGNDGDNNVDGADDDKNEARDRDHRTNLEKAVGRGINAQSGVTLAQQYERFPMLKGAPMVLQKSGTSAAGGGGKNEEKSAVDVTGLNFKPLGQVLRNVQCLKCGKWGHARGDRECELSGWNPFASVPALAAPVPAPIPAAVAPAEENSQLNMDPTEGQCIVAVQTADKRRKHEKDEMRRSRKKDGRHRKKKRKHKRRRRERSPSYSSYDSASSYSSSDYGGSHKNSRRYRRHEDSDDSDRDGRHRSRTDAGRGSKYHRSSSSKRHGKTSSSRRR